MKKQLLLITSLSAFATVAFAGQPDAKFKSLDANQDGYISQQEASTYDRLSTKWDDLDVNKDDQLDRAEFSAFEIEQPAGKMDSPVME